ncbi:MAG: hypothetical protein A4S09_12160 [Proteobacteria bacterium SG_bin7]|nr:MAG: hypothetical protein A4S09_12160 [Proteobacteria bacterium SG_bin7]
MKYIVGVITVGICILAIACGDSGKKVRSTPGANAGRNGIPNLNNSNQNLSTSKKNELSYSYNGTDCKTNQQQFTSKEELCKGLQNSKLNNNCALENRKLHFQRSCPNQEFQEHEE